MFDAPTYASRRRQLARQDDPEAGIALLLGNEPSPRNYAANTYPFRQDSTFLYYFGVDWPNLCGVLDLDEGTGALYGEESDVENVVWSGEQPSLDEMADAAGVDATGSPSDLRDRLRSALDDNRQIHLLPPYRAEHRLRYQDLLDISVEEIESSISEPLIKAVARQRSRKSEEEIAEIETALDVTAQVHDYASRHATPGTREREIYGALEGIATRENTSFCFPPTCSVRGEVLHNRSYDNTLEEGDLLLLDAGVSSSRQYASDITRVTPVGGRFSDRQRAIYEAVLGAQTAAIEALEPGVPFKDIHLLAARELTNHLIDIGLMQGNPEEAVAAGAHALFFPHGLGHFMGLDVHDMENLGEEHVGYAEGQTRDPQFGLHTLRLARPLRSGFVLTIEPGCYFVPPLVEAWRKENRHNAFINYEEVDHFLNFGGVRIEDDILITDEASRVLGPSIPKAPADVERRAGLEDQ